MYTSELILCSHIFDFMICLLLNANRLQIFQNSTLRKYNRQEVLRTQPTKSTSLSRLINFADCFCCIHIFSAKLLICCQTFINLKHRDIICRFSHESAEDQSVMFYQIKHASAGDLIHRHTDNLLDFHTNKTEHHLQTLTYWTLMNIKLTIQAKLNLQIFFVLFGRDKPWRNPRKCVTIGGKL